MKSAAGFDAVDGSSTSATSAIDVGAVRALMIRRSQMQTITTVGLDIAKSVFQVHCVDANGDVVLRRQLKRRYVLAFFQKLPPCLVGIEASPKSSQRFDLGAAGRRRGLGEAHQRLPTAIC